MTIEKTLQGAPDEADTCKEPKTLTLYSMELGDEIVFSYSTHALRVPGGWIFTVYRENGTGACDSSSCFVRFDNEFWSVQS